jgi:hypothetical protein
VTLHEMYDLLPALLTLRVKNQLPLSAGFTLQVDGWGDPVGSRVSGWWGQERKGVARAGEARVALPWCSADTPITHNHPPERLLDGALPCASLVGVVEEAAVAAVICGIQQRRALQRAEPKGLPGGKGATWGGRGWGAQVWGHEGRRRAAATVCSCL